MHIRILLLCCQVVSRQHVRMVVWERGAGRTLACGTGALLLLLLLLLAAAGALVSALGLAPVLLDPQPLRI